MSEQEQRWIGPLPLWMTVPTAILLAVLVLAVLNLLPKFDIVIPILSVFVGTLAYILARK